jgi:hypothetical protein
MSDGYQVGVLSLINVCFSKIYGDDYTSEISTRLGNALFVGIVLGQVPYTQTESMYWYTTATKQNTCS